MENRMVSTIGVVVFIGIVSHIASSQTIDEPAVPCSTSEDCQHSHLPAGAKCSSGFCVCMDDSGAPHSCLISHSQPKSAVHSPVAAHTCKLDQDCQQLQNGYCNTAVNQCVCSPGFVMATASYTCLPTSRSMGSTCDQDEQCTAENTTCRNSQCVCSTGFHYSENGCWRTAEIGQTCSTNQECSHVSNAICSEEMICTCANNSVLHSQSGRCLTTVTEMLGECADSVQCSKFTDAECINKRCECKENNHFEATQSRCVPSKHVGDSCSEHYECYQDKEGDESVEPQSCIGSPGVCTCNENFRKDGDKCVSSVASSLGPVVYMSVLLCALLFSRS